MKRRPVMLFGKCSYPIPSDKRLFAMRKKRLLYVNDKSLVYPQFNALTLKQSEDATSTNVLKYKCHQYYMLSDVYDVIMFSTLQQRRKRIYIIIF